MHTIKITPNLLFESQRTSGKFIRLPNRIDKNNSVTKIESKLFWHELECSNTDSESRRYCCYHHSIICRSPGGGTRPSQRAARYRPTTYGTIYH